MNGGQVSGLRPLSLWFDGVVGSEEEREVADAVLNLVGAVADFIPSTSYYQQPVGTRNAFEKVAVAMLELRSTVRGLP